MFMSFENHAYGVYICASVNYVCMVHKKERSAHACHNEPSYELKILVDWICRLLFKEEKENGMNIIKYELSAHHGWCQLDT